MTLREWLRKLAVPTVVARVLVHGRPKLATCLSRSNGTVTVDLKDGYEVVLTIPENPGFMTRMFYARRLKETLASRKRWRV